MKYVIMIITFLIALSYKQVHIHGSPITAQLPNKGNSSKITIKNSIIYHVTKSIQSVETDTFLSRRINIGPVVNGIAELQKVRERVSQLCSSIPKVIKERQKKVEMNLEKQNKINFYFLDEAGKASHTEARQRCTAKGLMLPEVYDLETKKALKSFMEKNQITSAHAGIYFDTLYYLQRFYTTGFPLWMSSQKKFLRYNPKQNSFDEVTTSYYNIHTLPEAKFFYTPTAELAFFYEELPDKQDILITPNYYRGTRHKVQEFATWVICQKKWNGTGFKGGLFPRTDLPEGWANTIIDIPDGKIMEALKKGKRSTGQETTDEKSVLEQGCQGIVDDLGEISERSNFRLINLLSLVDISVQSTDAGRQSLRQTELNNSTTSKNERSRRALPMFLFTNGVKSIWSLMGFVDKIRTNRRLNRLEDSVCVLG